VDANIVIVFLRLSF